jgi:peptidoglycan/xylan/chitin deacetylase (PgdA/CDA1 family)
MINRLANEVSCALRKRGESRLPGACRPATDGTMKLLFGSIFLALMTLLFAGSPFSADAAEPRYVAMIFDDGPVAEQTDAMLKVLADHKVRVSFAYVGRNVVRYPELAKRAAAAGHELINHSYTHPHLTQLDDAAVKKEIADTQDAIASAVGHKPAWFWAPYGDWNSRVESAVRAAGLEHFPAQRFTVISTDDWNREVPAAEIRRRATAGLGAKTVIICHEWREETLAELPAILAEYKRQGVELVTFSDLVRSGK